jgi:hypothetical protein
MYILFSAIISFSKISSAQKQEAEEFGVCCFSWEEFSQLVGFQSTLFFYIFNAYSCLH